MFERIPTSPPTISPVANDADRPLWSIMIPTYNCSNYLKDTLASVLVQDTGVQNMQIEVVDDCSKDMDVSVLVNEIGKGRVSFFKQQQNAGSLRNFETCLNRSTGEYIHILHGDDLVKPGYYAAIEKLFQHYPTIGAAFTGLSAIDENGDFLYENNRIQNHPGIIQDWLPKIASNQLLRTCAIVVKRSVYEELGGYFGVHYGEDWEMFVRIAAKYPVAYSPDNLALYRLHENNISARYLSTGQNIKDTKKVINIIQGYLPVENRKAIKRISSKNFAVYFTGYAQGIYRKHGDAKVALKQAQGALSLCTNQFTIISLIKLYLKILIGYKPKH
jgi:glycosyltransferase involved in cell wall biosynthesis